MKAVKSFDVMESFGMNNLTPEELMEIDGGDCGQLKWCFSYCETKNGNGSGNENSSNNGNGSGNNGNGNGNGSGTGNGNGSNLTDRGYPSSKGGN